MTAKPRNNVSLYACPSYSGIGTLFENGQSVTTTTIITTITISTATAAAAADDDDDGDDDDCTVQLLMRGHRSFKITKSFSDLSISISL